VGFEPGTLALIAYVLTNFAERRLKWKKPLKPASKLCAVISGKCDEEVEYDWKKRRSR